MENNDQNSNEVLQSILSKPGGLESLLKFANLIGVDTLKKNMNTKQTDSTRSQNLNELLLSILEKPDGLDTLIQIAELRGVNLPKEEITAEKIKEALSSNISTTLSNTSQQTTEEQNPPQSSDSFSEQIQTILSQHLSPILEKITPTNAESTTPTTLPLQDIKKALTSIFKNANVTINYPSQTNLDNLSSMVEKQISDIKTFLSENTSIDTGKGSQLDSIHDKITQLISKIEELSKKEK